MHFPKYIGFSESIWEFIIADFGAVDGRIDALFPKESLLAIGLNTGFLKLMLSIDTPLLLTLLRLSLL